MKQDALALFHPNRFAVAQHTAIDSERIVANLIPMRHTFGEGGLHLALPLRLEAGYGLGRREKIHRHVSTLAQRRLKLLQREKDLTVVIARVASLFDVNRSDEAAIL